jgi:4-hydroxybenzoate polyprenyltransferase
VSAQLGAIYWLGITIVSGILVWEHRLVRPDDLSRVNRAFFDLNAYVSVGYFLITLGDLAWRA